MTLRAILFNATTIAFRSDSLMRGILSLLPADDAFAKFHQTKHQRKAANQDYGHYCGVDHDASPGEIALLVIGFKPLAI